MHHITPFPLGSTSYRQTVDFFACKPYAGQTQIHIRNNYERLAKSTNDNCIVFATIGKSGRSTTAKTEAIGRLVSLALRSGVKVENIVEQLKDIGGEHPVFQKDGLVLSIPDAICRVLEKRYLKNKPIKNSGKRPKSLLGETCPECGQTISFEEGCMTCHFCGFTKCG